MTVDNCFSINKTHLMIIGLYFEGIRMILVLEAFPYLMLDFLYVLPSMELMYMAFLEPPECEVIYSVP